MTPQSYILYAEDDTDDQAILKESMRRVDPSIQVICFLNGYHLFSFLEGLNPGALLPACIILDMNMPVWTGMETLEMLKRHAVYRSVPVFIFSTSSTGYEKKQAESLNAEAFITKPYAQTELFRVCQEFAEYSGREQKAKTGTVDSSY